MKTAPFKLDVFDELKESLADAAERVFRDAIAAHSDETFYAFVLTSYGNRLGGASANTVENHERIWSAVQEERPDDHDPEWKWHYKWVSRAWGDYELIGDQSAFDRVRSIDRRARAALSDFFSDADVLNKHTDIDFGSLNPHPEESGPSWSCLDGDPFFAAVAGALGLVTARGVFGSGAELERVVLFVEEYESVAFEEPVALWSARRLNSMAAFQKFELEYNRALDCGIADAD
jgi:Domain of unknown function (DUF4303)